jgi:hypothetical protein
MGVAEPLNGGFPAASALETNVDAEILRIDSMDVDALRRLWIRQHGERPPAAMSKGLLALALAYRLQEKAFGGLDARPRKTLRSFESASGKSPAFIKPGSMLVREYQGVVHEVEVVSGGYRWNSQTWASLTVIARAITGTNWNGPRFFGLRNAGKPIPQQQGVPS